MSLPVNLAPAERKRLRGEAMRLKPAVIVGRSGVTPTVLDEVDAALARESLIKVRVEAPERSTRGLWLRTIAQKLSATICGEVGHTASLYRPRPAPDTGKGKRRGSNSPE